MRPQDADSVKPEHWKQRSTAYCFGDAPTIENEQFERLMNHALNPRNSINDCDTITEQKEYLELNELKDTPEYELTSESYRIVKVAERLKMKLLAKYIENKELPAKFVNALVQTGAIDSFKKMTGGTKWSTPKQSNFLKTLGMPSGQIDPPFKQGVRMSKNEASLLIDAALKAKGKPVFRTKWTMPEGKFEGKPIWEVPHVARSVILKKYPCSANARLIRNFQESQKKK